MARKLKLMVCIIVAISMLILVGGQIVSAGEPPYGDTFDGITLRWIVSPQAATDAITALLPEFEKATGMKIIADVMDEERMYTKLTTEHAAEIHNYDIIPMREVDVDPYIDLGIVQPLDPYINSPKLPEPLNIKGFPKAYFDSQARRYGKIWGPPLGSGTTFLAYRRDWFEEAGMTAPKTWDQLFEGAEHFTQPDKRRYGIVFRAARGHHAAYAWYTTALYPFGGEQFYYETLTPIYNNPRNVESLATFAELSKYAPPDVVTFTHEEASSAYATGKVALFSETDLLLPWVESEDSLAAGKTEYIVIPKKYERVKTWTGVVGWIYGMSALTEYPEAVMAFIEYFTSERIGKKMALYGAMPELSSTLLDPELLKTRPWYKFRFDAMEVARYIHPKVKPTIAVNEIVGTHVNAALIGEESPQEALDKAQAEVLDLLKERNIYKVVK